MKPFSLDPGMRAMIGGAFYPTGYSMVMFPEAEAARAVGQQLADRGFGGDDVHLITPELLLSQITPTVEDADSPLPSAGTDAATVRAYSKLAREGHSALLVRTDDEAAAERLMVEVRKVKYSIAQRYRTLVIEDL